MNYFLLVGGTLFPSLLVAWSTAFVVRRLAHRWGLVDKPNSRKVHQIPTPLGGGLAIAAGVVLPLALGQLILFFAKHNYLDTLHFLPEFTRPHLPGLLKQSVGLWVLLGGGMVLIGLGLLDDLRGLPWQLRLAIECLVAATCVVWQGWQLTAFIGIPVLTYALSVVWIVALINSFNMLDNMDGLSAGVAAITAGTLAAMLLLTPDPETQRPQLFVAGFLLVLVGSLLGFLWHNRTPARIFMGDAGSYFVGFSIAIATLLATYTTYHGTTQHAVAAPLMMMAVPLYDMVSVLLIRIRERRSPFHADKSHFSHRLVDLGLSKSQAVWTIYLMTFTCGLCGMLLPRVDLMGAALITILIVCVLALIAILETTARRLLRH